MDRSAAVLETVETLLARSEFEVVDVECVPGHRGTTVRVFVDREGGVTIDDCARLSRAIGDQFEATGILGGSYVLEVSSPGVDRPLRKAVDYARFVGETVEVATFEKIEGRHNHKGVLSAYDEEQDRVTIADEAGGTTSFPRAAVKKAHLKRDPWLGTRDHAGGKGGSRPAKEKKRKTPGRAGARRGDV